MLEQTIEPRKRESQLSQKLFRQEVAPIQTFADRVFIALRVSQGQWWASRQDMKPLVVAPYCGFTV